MGTPKFNGDKIKKRVSRFFSSQVTFLHPDTFPHIHCTNTSTKITLKWIHHIFRSKCWVFYQEPEGRLTRGWRVYFFKYEYARFCRHPRVFEKVATLLICLSEHPKLRLLIDGQFCISTLYILQLLFLPHECGQIHRKPPF